MYACSIGPFTRSNAVLLWCSFFPDGPQQYRNSPIPDIFLQASVNTLSSSFSRSFTLSVSYFCVFRKNHDNHKPPIRAQTCTNKYPPTNIHQQISTRTTINTTRIFSDQDDDLIELTGRTRSPIIHVTFIHSSRQAQSRNQ